MPIRRRVRCFAKYAGLGLCVMIFIAWITSRWWEGSIGYAAKQKAWVAGVSEGNLLYGRMTWDEDKSWRIRFDRGVFAHQTLVPPDSADRWYFHQALMPEPRWVWLRRCWLSGGNAYVWLPLWLPLIAIALPTAWMIFRDCRAIPGHCPNCRYDLTGNTSNVCPECGHAVANNQA